MAAGSKPACGAKKRQQEEDGTVTYCTLSAGWGTDHLGTGRCKFHGGNTKTQKTGARRVQAERQARAVLAELAVQPVADPLTALMQLGGQVIAWQEATASLVNRLGEEIRYEGGTGAEQLRAEVQLYERSMDRAEKVLSSIARLNIEERLAQISEAQADRVLAAIDAALAAAGLGGAEAAKARQVAARQLRAV